MYHVPMNPVSELPFMSINQFPLKGNPFQVNGTHIFWPVDQNLFSKFYMNLRTENEEFYGISQQNFVEVPHSDDVASRLQVSDLYKSDLQVSSRFANDLM